MRGYIVIVAIIALPATSAAAPGNDSSTKTAPAIKTAPATKTAPARSWPTLVRDANVHLRGARFAAARADYQAAYAIKPEPLLLYNIGFCYQREDETELAITYFERYLQATVSTTDPVTLRQRTLTEESLVTLKSQLVTPPPEPAPPRVKAPPRPPVDHTARAPGRTWRWAGLGAGTTGGLLLALGASRLLRARSLSDELASTAPGTQWSAELSARDNDAKAARSQGLVLSVVGAGAIAMGITFYVMGARRDRKRRGTRVGLVPSTVVPYVGSDELGLAVMGRF